MSRTPSRSHRHGRAGALLLTALVAAGLAGCVGGAQEPPLAAPIDAAAPEQEPVVVTGSFTRAAHLRVGPESQYVHDGEATLAAPPGAKRLALTLEWDSPIGTEYELRVGENGHYLGDPVAGPSPLTLEVVAHELRGELRILVQPHGEAGAAPYTEFRWEARFS